jgi:hypothetical protein
MAGRDAEFTEATKTALSKRAGFRCSYPGCNAVTVGPSGEGGEATASTGMACHIYSASDAPPARRRNSGLPLEKLASIENGIWMCYSHGKLIDADESAYTPEILKGWRRLFWENREVAWT